MTLDSIKLYHYQFHGWRMWRLPGLARGNR
jgi:hypothetical protein